MASRGFPSMTALLGLLAIAGYQNRDKIAEMIKDFSNKNQAGGPAGGGAQQGELGRLGRPPWRRQCRRASQWRPR